MPTSSRGSNRFEFPTIREQDLALIIADWIRMKVQQPPARSHPFGPGREPDALDLTSIIGELSSGLHAHSLGVIYEAIPKTERWAHLRERFEALLAQKRTNVEEFAEYPDRSLPVH